MLESLAQVFDRPEPPQQQEEMGFFTDTTLCIGCKACEVACKQWNQLPADGFNWTGNSYDNTGELSATSWRHVKFIEQLRPEDEPGRLVSLPLLPSREREVASPVALAPGDTPPVAHAPGSP